MKNEIDGVQLNDLGFGQDLSELRASSPSKQDFNPTTAAEERVEAFMNGEALGPIAKISPEDIRGTMTLNRGTVALGLVKEAAESRVEEFGRRREEFPSLRVGDLDDPKFDPKAQEALSDIRNSVAGAEIVPTESYVLRKAA
jgi:hypothetical protein